MKRSATNFAVAFILGALASACSRPSTESCKTAIANIQSISGTDMDTVGPDPTAAIRSCRGNASKKSVACLTEAKTIEDLENCEGGVYDRLFPRKKPEDAKNNGEAKTEQ